MQVWAHAIRVIGHHLKQLPRNLRGLDAREANAKLARQRSDRANQVGKPHPFAPRLRAIEIDPVVSQMDAGEHDFTVSVPDDPSHLLENVPDGSARKPWPHVW